jgi:class 3 adenylate cyclase
MSTFQAEPEKLRASIAALEAQRAVLGDAVVDTALASLREKLVALQARTAETTAAAERRFITILFSDVMGSVTLAEKLDPEEWRDAIAQVQSAIGRVVTQQGGMVAQYQGDALIAFFGARAVSESDPENAVRAGLAAQSAVAHLKAGGTLTLPSPLEIRVGIHTGLVVLGEWGADAKIEFGAFGDAVNVAARLQTAAPPGGVLISEDTYRHVRGIFDVTPRLLKARPANRPTSCPPSHARLHRDAGVGV